MRVVDAEKVAAVRTAMPGEQETGELADVQTRDLTAPAGTPLVAAVFSAGFLALCARAASGRPGWPGRPALGPSAWKSLAVKGGSGGCSGQ